MGFDFIERSNSKGQPSVLYEFTIGDHRWGYTNAENDVVVLGQLYLSAAISDNGLTLSGDSQNDDFNITMPATAEFTTLFQGPMPGETIYCTVRLINRGDTQAPVAWVGTVKQGTRKDKLSFEVTCKALSSSLNRNGLRLAWGRGCPHALYDRGCQANPAAFAVAVQIQGLTGATVTSSSFESLPHNYLSGGYIEFEILAGVTERRAIEAHGGNYIMLLGTTEGLSTMDWIVVYPGCDRTSSTCQGKFNNLSNYGGFPHLPNKSPFDGDPVF